ncbi:sugar ABC transporter ATP-binding protein [Agrobacterium sp. LAD9]|uniref:sugar ABC transporter ATP-binding protein n=1 Tax=Agrobacterium sp. LAD9 TaxID=2055153 RepID=UPI000D1D7A15|nr:sugar ABC transporter ATP-binding protein [Agrobacterium sp. LAD9]
MSATQSNAIVEIRQLTKDFSGVPVLKGVDLSFERAEVHGLLGENGAGKSTLIKILTGIYSQTAGTIMVDGEVASIRGPIDAHGYGLGAVYQDAEMVTGLTVAENILLGNEPGGVFIDRPGIFRKAQEIVDTIGLDLDVHEMARNLTAAQMQLVTLAMLFHRRYKLIILDEPTARLSGNEVDLLFTLIERFKAQGITIVYISHRLDEVKKICDRATILRGGRVSATLGRSEITEERVTELMVDRSKKNLEVRNKGLARQTVALEVRNLSNARLSSLSFSIRAGEVLGITGPVGGGMEQVEKILGGLTGYAGEVLVSGALRKLGSPALAQQSGIALIPEDRRKQALFPNLSVADNIAMPVLRRFGRLSWVRSGHKLAFAQATMNQLNINPRVPERTMKFLSGGNQQKAVIGKWMSSKSGIYIFVEPTSGVDVGAIPEIYATILGLSEHGAAIIVISSSLNEILSLSETTMVIRKGQRIFEGPTRDCTYDQVLSLVMSGQAIRKAIA